MGEERPKRMVLSVQASLDALRKSWLQMKLRELMELKNKQVFYYLNKMTFRP